MASSCDMAAWLCDNDYGPNDTAWKVTLTMEVGGEYNDFDPNIMHEITTVIADTAGVLARQIVDVVKIIENVVYIRFEIFVTNEAIAEVVMEEIGPEITSTSQTSSWLGLEVLDKPRLDKNDTNLDHMHRPWFMNISNASRHTPEPRTKHHERPVVYPPPPPPPLECFYYEKEPENATNATNESNGTTDDNVQVADACNVTNGTNGTNCTEPEPVYISNCTVVGNSTVPTLIGGRHGPLGPRFGSAGAGFVNAPDVPGKRVVNDPRPIPTSRAASTAEEAVAVLRVGLDGTLVRPGAGEEHLHRHRSDEMAAQAMAAAAGVLLDDSSNSSNASDNSPPSPPLLPPPISDSSLSDTPTYYQAWGSLLGLHIVWILPLAGFFVLACGLALWTVSQNPMSREPREVRFAADTINERGDGGIVTVIGEEDIDAARQSTKFDWQRSEDMRKNKHN